MAQGLRATNSCAVAAGPLTLLGEPPASFRAVPKLDTAVVALPFDERGQKVLHGEGDPPARREASLEERESRRSVTEGCVEEVSRCRSQGVGHLAQSGFLFFWSLAHQSTSVDYTV